MISSVQGLAKLMLRNGASFSTASCVCLEYYKLKKKKPTSMYALLVGGKCL